LTKVVEIIIAEDSELLLDGNKSILAEHDDFHYHCEDLQADLAGIRSDAEKRTANLELSVKSAGEK
jgi:hypothetical protein